MASWYKKCDNSWNNFQIDAFAFVDPNHEFLQQFPLRRLPHYLRTICSARKFVGFTPRFTQYQRHKYTIPNAQIRNTKFTMQCTKYTIQYTKYTIQYTKYTILNTILWVKPRFAQYRCRSLITTWHPGDLHLHRHLYFCIDFECHLWTKLSLLPLHCLSGLAIPWCNVWAPLLCFLVIIIMMAVAMLSTPVRIWFQCFAAILRWKLRS